MTFITQYDAAVRVSEKEYVEAVEKVLYKLNDLFNCGITHLRFARKSKSFGALAYSFHLYTYRSEPGKLEAWVNLSEGSAFGPLTIDAFIRSVVSTIAFQKNTYDAKKCTAEHLKAKFPNAPANAKFTSKHKMSALHHAYMTSAEVTELVEQVKAVVTEK